MSVALLAALGLQALPPAARSQDAPRARTGQGELVGVKGKGGQALFLGVPFAQPPVGALRWKPPRPVSWRGSREATVQGPACLQRPWAGTPRTPRQSARTASISTSQPEA
jgi:para-nitrobenzyl esterase